MDYVQIKDNPVEFTEIDFPLATSNASPAKMIPVASSPDSGARSFATMAKSISDSPSTWAKASPQRHARQSSEDEDYVGWELGLDNLSILEEQNSVGNRGKKKKKVLVSNGGMRGRM